LEGKGRDARGVLDFVKQKKGGGNPGPKKGGENTDLSGLPKERGGMQLQCS